MRDANLNLLGSIVRGILTEFFVVHCTLPPELRLFMTMGFLSRFTTFSTYLLDTAGLWERGQCGLVPGYVANSLVVSTVCLFVGLSFIRIAGNGS